MDTSRPAALGAASLSLVLIASATVSVAQPSRGVPAGADLFRTQQGVADFGAQPVPPGFFGPGSLPFGGLVQLVGEPLGTAGAFALGNADTVIQRVGPLLTPDPPPIPVEIVELQLRSVAPVVVQTMPFPTQWDVSVGIPAPPTPQGRLEANPLPEGGGTFTLELPVRPVFTFTQVGNPANVVTLAAPPVVLAGAGPYAEGPACPADARLLPVLGSGRSFCPASQGGARMPLLLASPSLTLQLQLAATVAAGGATIDASATVDPSAEIGDGAVVGAGARIGRNAVIGPDAQVGAGARVGPDCVIGEGASVGDDARLGAACFVDDGASLGAGVTLQRDVSVGAGTTIGAGSRLGGGASVGAEAAIGVGVTIGGRTRVGHRVLLDDGTTVRGRLVLADDSDLSGLVADDTLTCQLLTGTQPMTAGDCEQAGGHVYGNIGDILIGLDPALTFPVLETVLPDPPDLEDAQDVLDDSGIPDEEYETDSYDCDDFAGDAEEELEAAGFDATFTVYWRWEPFHRWVNRKWVGAWVDGHAVLDVHVGGTIKWLEPQKKSTDPGGNVLDLDFDGDGTVEYATDHGSALTDDSYRIEVYDSRQAAEDAGVVMD